MSSNFNYTNIIAVCDDLGCPWLKDEPMSRHTSFRIGGPADLFVTAVSEKALCKLVAALKEENIPYFVVGNGSNLLVSDEGFRGVVLTLGGELKKISLEKGRIIHCGGGVSLASLCAFARDNGLTGLEFAWGIPATAGGAAFMNAGAYGGEMKNVLVSCSHVDGEGKIGEFSGDELELSYRHSAYHNEENKDKIITSLTLILEKGDETQIAAQMDDFMGRRKDKQPLEYPSAGSTFKRPEGYFAGALIEQCGLKGKSVGGAQVSVKHAGFVINTGDATCEDVLGLVEFIKETVLREKGVELECEIKMI